MLKYLALPCVIYPSRNVISACHQSLLRKVTGLFNMCLFKKVNSDVLAKEENHSKTCVLVKQLLHIIVVEQSK